MPDKKNINKKNPLKKNQAPKIDSIKIITILFAILIICLIAIRIKKENNETAVTSAKVSQLFSSIDTAVSANITKYIVYGTYFNLEGTLEAPKISGISIDCVDLIAKNISGNELIIPSNYTYSNGTLAFSSCDEINSGLNLESLTIDKYFLLLKVTYSNSDVRYYSFSNSTEYGKIDYYTITKNNTNNQLEINFDLYNNISYMFINVSKCDKLPDNVYDIIIDPGHGGLDAGAVSKDHKEAEIVLDCAKILKEKLENLGLKVKLTRDGTEPKNLDTAYNMYDDDGRITIINESGSKIAISLHLNSNTSKVKDGGLEVYAPSNCNLDFARSLADNITSLSGASYSNLTTYKKYDGVYVRNFTNSDILSFKSKAEKSGYEPYNITTSTPYLYLIREIGGICTNAFVDGRNTAYSANKYIDSNVGVEGYLIELGYMIVDSDLQNVLNNKDLYMEGISKSIQEFYLN